ncbi:MAG TPA: hypothetical protein DDW17_09975 [Deltaproteobacteria bacterium]|nr:hypothetical protein [Deltaproteobacteria bacterium]
MKYVYEINGKRWIQKPLVIGQVKQLISIIGHLKIPGNIDIPGLIALLGEELPRVIAIILTPEGMSLREKEIDTLEKELEETLYIETAIQVIEDFFDLNPIALSLERLTGAIEKIQSQMIQSKSSSVSSQEETSQKETKSNGDIPSENAKNMSNIKDGM